jgi:hypothetical protein
MGKAKKLYIPLTEDKISNYNYFSNVYAFKKVLMFTENFLIFPSN